jgi:hypothetical protein
VGGRRVGMRGSPSRDADQTSWRPGRWVHTFQGEPRGGPWEDLRFGIGVDADEKEGWMRVLYFYLMKDA